MLEQTERIAFFRTIADRLLPEGLLASSNLVTETSSEDFKTLLRLWLNVMTGLDVSIEQFEKARSAYAKDVAILAPTSVASLIESGVLNPPYSSFKPDSFMLGFQSVHG
ncbi:MAG: hypothetical protein R2880_04410 [Deinococcales bacterium]